MKKSIIRLFSSLVLIFSFIFPTFATTDSQFDNDTIIEQSVSMYNEPVTMRKLSSEEAAVELSKAYNIGYAEALEIVLDDLTRGITYQDAIIYKNFGKAPDGTVYADWKVEVGATLRVAIGSGHTNFMGEPIRTWSGAVSSGIYSWEESYEPIAELTSPTSVYLRARGVCYVAFNFGQQFGFDIGIISNILGFSSSSSTGYTYYFRQPATIAGTYTIGQNPEV